MNIHPPPQLQNQEQRREDLKVPLKPYPVNYWLCMADIFLKLTVQVWM